MQNRRKLIAVLFGSAIGLGLQSAYANDPAPSPGTSGASANTSRSASQTVDDATITSKVKAALVRDDLVKARNIDVDTSRGVVKLSGTVASDAEVRQALTLARQTNGVVEVQSNLNIGRP
jgi:hyperosmotically inducible periplasmic protein